MLWGVMTAEVFPETQVGVLQGLHQVMVPCGLSSHFPWGVWDNELTHSQISALPQAQFLESPACFLIIMNNSWLDDLFMSQTSFVRSSFDFYKWSSFNLLDICVFFFFLKNDPNSWLLKVNRNFILLFLIQKHFTKNVTCSLQMYILKICQSQFFTSSLSPLSLSLYLFSLFSPFPLPMYKSQCSVLAILFLKVKWNKYHFQGCSGL